MDSKYQTIINHILDGIEQGHYQRGQKLPSIRQLSKQYQCSKDTVQKAFLELRYQKAIYAVEKSGYYVLEDKAFQEESLDLTLEDFEQLPYEDFRICLNESLIGRENYLFNYYHQQEGLEELIASSQRLLADSQVFCKKDQVIITSGTQQALYILSHMPFPNQGQDILLENPTYYRMQHLLDQQGIPYQTIERTLSGIDLKRLEEIFQTGQIKFFYTIPHLHNPLGSSLSLETKKEIIRLAQAYGVYLVEDDYLADFDLDSQVPLHYLDTEERVIYLKSFTTTLFPALRLGSVALPRDLVATFLRDKSLIDYDTNLIMQKALSLYIDNGMFKRNTKQLRDHHRSVREEIAKVLETTSLPFPYQVGKETLVLQLKNQQLLPHIKHSKLPLQVISTDQFSYLILPYGSHFKEDVATLAELVHKKRSH